MSEGNSEKPLDSAKESAGDAAEHAKHFAEDATENVKGLGAKIAGLFKRGK